MIKIINGSGLCDIAPMYLARSDDMREMDSDALKRLEIPLADLMEKAAKSVFDYINKKLRAAYTAGITVLCGMGNNGGDGYALSRMFCETGRTVTALNIFGSLPKSGAALLHYNRLVNLADTNKSADIKILNCADLSDENLQKIFCKSDIIIDAVFGTGFKGALDGEARRILKLANSVPDCTKISVDAPSGTDCDSGGADTNSFKADYTLTFEFAKQGLVSYPAAGYAGTIVVLSIGFTEETRNILLSRQNKSVLLSDNYIKNLFESQDSQNKRKSQNTNKGDFGKLLAICGSKNMTGAAYFAAMGALRTGAGLLYLASDAKIIPVLQTKLNEPVFVPLDYSVRESNIKAMNAVEADAVLIGPGIGIENGREIINILNLMLKAKSPLALNAKTIIFDADGINALCENINILHEIKAGKVLTPHPGEMARLCKAAGFGKALHTPAGVQENRINAASDFALKYSCVVVLKGAGTVIADEKGGIYINNTGNPGMSKGGSGDILAGMIASYCAQGMSPADSACIAVHLHGLAGDIAAQKYSEIGMIPSDMTEIIAEIQK